MVVDDDDDVCAQNQCAHTITVTHNHSHSLTHTQQLLASVAWLPKPSTITTVVSTLVKHMP